MNNEINTTVQTNGHISNAITVTQLNEYIKRLIDSTVSLNHVAIKGEISNFKNHYSTGHFYFTLKDESSQIRAVMFRSSAAKMQFLPEDGMKVIACGRISAFVRDGTVQLYCDTMEPDGIGALYIAYEQLKNKLASEGLFNEERKKALPKIPTRVGIITSATGAAVRDIITVCGRRFPYAKLILYPSLVQGKEAPAQLISAMQYFNRSDSVDVIIIGRGGGSIEDLWAFNDEGLVRTVAASHIPVISAVGHETDFTLCDFAADRRAPTPSAAAELAVPEVSELKRKINNIITRESDVLYAKIKVYKEKLIAISRTRSLSDPMNFINDSRIELDRLYDRLMLLENTDINLKKSSLALQAGKLNVLNPLSVLARGYSAVYKEDGTLVKKIDDVCPGDKVSFKTIGGEALCSVDQINETSCKSRGE